VLSSSHHRRRDRSAGRFLRLGCTVSRFALSAAGHVAASPVFGLVQFGPQNRKLSFTGFFNRTTSVYYSPSEYLPPLDTAVPITSTTKRQPAFSLRNPHPRCRRMPLTIAARPRHSKQKKTKKHIRRQAESLCAAAEFVAWSQTQAHCNAAGFDDVAAHIYDCPSFRSGRRRLLRKPFPPSASARASLAQASGHRTGCDGDPPPGPRQAPQAAVVAPTPQWTPHRPSSWR